MNDSLKQHIKHGLTLLGWGMLRLGGRRPQDPRLSVIMYHSAGGGAKASIDAHVLDAHFQAMRERYSRFITVSEAAEVENSNSPDWPVAITFDDGYEDNHSVVLPLLKKHGLRATFFVCSGLIDGRAEIRGRRRSYEGLRAMSWHQVRELADAGMEIGAHTDTHPLLAQLSDARQEAEMLISKERTQREVGLNPISFAIPYGTRGTFTRSTLSLAGRHFQACCTTLFSTNPLPPKRHGKMILLNRVQAAARDHSERVLEKLSGRWDAMRILQRSQNYV